MRRHQSVCFVGIAALFLGAGCSSSHAAEADGGRALDAFRTPPRDSGTGVDAFVVRPPLDSGAPRRDARVPSPPDTGVVCGSVLCGPAQECCLLTIECFDPADAGACEIPAASAGDPDACVSNLDCDEGELCERADIFSSGGQLAPACGGTVGYCVRMRAETECGGFGEGVCGCDGRTYADPCAASRAGVRISWHWPCGRRFREPIDQLCDPAHPDCGPGMTCDVAAGRCVATVGLTACGIDEQCPEGESCCNVVGACMRSDCPECCFVPPAGTHYPCRDNADCAALDEEGDSSRWYCGTEPCDGGGGCLRRERGCGGELDPVCGCNGITYSNRCWASSAATAIASEGECP